MITITFLFILWSIIGIVLTIIAKILQCYNNKWNFEVDDLIFCAGMFVMGPIALIFIFMELLSWTIKVFYNFIGRKFNLCKDGVLIKFK
jgi:hypothetical protein